MFLSFVHPFAISSLPSTKHTAMDFCEPIAPVDALYTHANLLTDYEKEEILNYRDIFCLGDGVHKIDAVYGAPQNSGYDDKNGRYLAKIGDHVAYRYKIESGLGKGAFGDCFRAFDFKTGAHVALKIIRNEPRFHRQGKIECNILKQLTEYDKDDTNCVVHMLDNFKFRNHLCITFEMLGRDIYSELKQGDFVGFAPDRIRRITKDILTCLQTLNGMGIVHADLKPENILLHPDEQLSKKRGGMKKSAKVIDFGSSCYVHQKPHTYIQSRYYRSPEIVLGLGYDNSIDMWSLGCILYEMDTAQPLFPVKNEQDLILYMCELLGVPPMDVLHRSRRAEVFFSGGMPLKNRDKRGKIHQVGSRSLKDACKNKDPMFIDFIQRCLTWDPTERMTPEEAMNHPWIQHIRVKKGRTSFPLSDHMVVDDCLNDSGFADESIDQEVPTSFGSAWYFSPQSDIVPEIC